MGENKETATNRSLTNVCSNCKTAYSNMDIPIANSIGGTGCSSCGKKTGTLTHPLADVRHTSLRPYIKDISKTEQQKISELNSTSSSNNRNNILRVGAFNSPRHRTKNKDMSREFARMILEEKLDICTLQELTSFPDHRSEELIKIPGAYDYTYVYQPFTYQTNGVAGNGLVSHLPFVTATHSQDKEANPDIHVKGVLNINGKRVSVYGIHFDAYNPGLMAYQLKKCAKAVAEDTNEYKIVAGDFNCFWTWTDKDINGNTLDYKYDVWKPLKDLGFVMAFDIYDPQFNMSNGDGTLDNILYNPDTMQLLNAYKSNAPDWIADHDLCCAEFKLL